MRMPKIDPNYMLIGRVLRPHGVRGELRVEQFTSIPEYFESEALFLGKRPSHLTRYEVESTRFHQGKALIKFAGVNDRDDVDRLRQLWVYLSREHTEPLEQGEFYLYQLIGMRVVSEEGEALGEVADTLQTGANDVFIVRGDRGEILIPDIDDVVLKVDGIEKTITVRMMDGLV